MLGSGAVSSPARVRAARHPQKPAVPKFLAAATDTAGSLDDVTPQEPSRCDAKLVQRHTGSRTLHRWAPIVAQLLADDCGPFATRETAEHARNSSVQTQPLRAFSPNLT